MEYTVILAEDEPSAMRYLKSLILQKCRGFRIISEEVNGELALEKIRKLKPDLLISDIRMPVMDGLELVSKVKMEYPQIFSVIVSGYQDFEYAKGAIQSDVVDYLLKPLNIDRFTKLMEIIYGKLSRMYYKRTESFILSLLSGNIVSREELDLLPCRLMTGVIRKNGLPSCTSRKCFFFPGNEVMKWIDCIMTTKERSVSWIFAGRDVNEVLLICFTGSISFSRFKEMAMDYSDRLRGDGYYSTAVRSSHLSLNINHILLDLYKLIRDNTIPGCNQLFFEGSVNTEKRCISDHVDSVFLNKLEYLISTDQFYTVIEEVVSLLDLWEKEKLPLVNMEVELRKILQLVLQYCPVQKNSQIELEQDLSLVLRTSPSCHQIRNSFLQILGKMRCHLEIGQRKVDSQEFFDSITGFLNHNLSEELSIPLICQLFGISQSYLSRIFRKYSNFSFIEYITNLRIKCSINLMKEQSNIPLKEIASIIGYQDPCYFSKVFKAHTGMSPRSYMHEKNP